MLPQIEHDGDTIALTSKDLRVVFDPRNGGKIRSFFSRQTHTQYLYQDGRQNLSNADYSNHDISGFDECFPTVMACDYLDDPWRGVALGDHGLLWDRIWENDFRDGVLTSRAALQAVPLTFSRAAELDGSKSLLLRYTIDNHGTAPFEYLYAAHIMLSADATTRIDYPPEMTRACVSVAIDNPAFDEGNSYDWPPSGASLVREPLLPQHGTLVKAFSPRLTEGRVTLAHGDRRERLTIEFSADQLPYLGVLLAPGFGPLGKDRSSTLLAIEPTSSMADDLLMARRTQSARRIAAGQSVQFWLRLTLQESLGKT